MNSMLPFIICCLFSFLNKNEDNSSTCDPDLCTVEHLKIKYNYIYDSRNDALYYLEKHIKNVYGSDYKRSNSVPWTVATKPPKHDDGRDCKNARHANIKIIRKSDNVALNETIALLEVEACDNGRTTKVYAFHD